MDIMAFIASVLGAMAVWIMARWALSSLPSSGPTVAEREKNIFTRCRPLLRPLSTALRGMIWPAFRRNAEAKLTAAGYSYSISVEEYFSLRFLFLLLALLCWPILPNALFYLVALFAVFFPELWIHSEILRRHAEIRRTLPYLVDLLSLCTSAGLEFGMAIDRVLANCEPGPLVSELKLARRETNLGLSLREALQHMANRVQMPELISFVAIMVQALGLGASVSDILEAQAEKMRLERYEKAERLGTQAQQKILLPLLLFILPAFILLGIVPILWGYFKQMSSGGLFGG